MFLLEGLDVATITMMSIEDLFAWIDDHPHTLLLNKQVVTLPPPVKFVVSTTVVLHLEQPLVDDFMNRPLDARDALTQGFGNFVGILADFVSLKRTTPDIGIGAVHTHLCLFFQIRFRG